MNLHIVFKHFIKHAGKIKKIIGKTTVYALVVTDNESTLLNPEDMDSWPIPIKDMAMRIIKNDKGSLYALVVIDSVGTLILLED